VLADLDLLSRAERGWLAEHGGAEPAADPGPAVAGPAARITAMIRERPGGEAVRAADGSLTYGDLGARSDELGAALRAAGVQAGHRVAVLGERGSAAVAAIVAVIRMNASFLAIADDAPAERIALMLAAARPAAIVVTSPELLAALPGQWRSAAVPHAAVWLAGSGAIQAGRHPGEAYVVFTSGSTGEPRGVSVSASALGAIASAWDEVFGFANRPARHLQLAPFSFDVFIGDLTRALCFGGTLVVADRGDVLEPRKLAGLIRRQRIDTVEFVPAVTRLLVDYLEHAGGGVPALRRVMVGSDIWMTADALRLRAVLPAAARLYCTYGVSEAAIDSTVYQVEADRPPGAAVVPIGRPFPGIQATVRDRLGRLLPPRLPGELWIGGATVASGYLLATDPNDDRFRAAQAPDGRPCRWYRTGDRAAWDEQGDLHLLGRLDSETKVRGVRVHPAEIEAVLGRHPAVTAAAVVAVGAAPHRTLVAFVTGTPQADCEQIAAHARRHLLPVAVPARFCLLDQIPTSRHGKVDHRALAELARSIPGPDGDRAEAASELERTVAAITAEVLGLPRIGATDDFYSLGASSVHIARLAWRLSLAAGREVSVREVIATPSVRALCDLVERRSQPDGSSAGLPDVAPVLAELRPPSAPVTAATPALRVVLTGVTGTLGPGILRALLAAGVGEVTCLVRGDDPDHARSRIRAALAAYGADPGLAADTRVRCATADLSQPDAGLPADGLAPVTAADALINAAAWVNFLYPYELLMPVNVGAVATLARLAGEHRRKPLHHLSTRSALTINGRAPEGGYNMSKAAAERLLERCRELGLPVCVYRPGFVLGELAARPSRPGLLESFLRECVLAGAHPDLPGCLNVVSADHVAARIADNVLSRWPADSLELVGSAPLPWSLAFDVLREHAVTLTKLPASEWLERVAGRQHGDTWFEPFLPLCRSAGLAELLCDDAADPAADPAAQPVADAWQRICAQLAELAGRA
jgi:amino acid adenylation domain-containing protein/thioester reductase-like protein